jgi:hypothetical protein
MSKEEVKKEESKDQKIARVLRDAYERLSAAGFPELDRDIKDLVDEYEKAAGIEFKETKTEPPRRPLPEDQKTAAQVKEDNAYKQEHRGEISQQKYDEAVGRDHRGQSKEEAAASDKSKDEQIAKQAKEGKAMEQQPEEVRKAVHKK